MWEGSQRKRYKGLQRAILRLSCTMVIPQFVFAGNATSLVPTQLSDCMRWVHSNPAHSTAETCIPYLSAEQKAMVTACLCSMSWRLPSEVRAQVLPGASKKPGYTWLWLGRRGKTLALCCKGCARICMTWMPGMYQPVCTASGICTPSILCSKHPSRCLSRRAKLHGTASVTCRSRLCSKHQP